MHLPPLDKLAIRPRERLPSPAEGSVLESEEAKGQWRAGKLKSTIDIQRAEIFQLKSWKERYTRKYQTVKTQNAAMEDKIEDISKTHRDTLKQRDQRIRAVEDELARTKDELSRTKDELARTKDGLARTKELLAARSIELSGAQSFLSTKDRLSEAEVLGIVRDLNENIFQLAAKLTEEWEKYKSKAYGKIRIPKDSVKAFSQLYGAALIVHALDRDPTAVTFLLQSCLCLSVTQISSSWRRDSYEDMETLESIYQNLSASEEQAISARWRSLTHSHLPEPSPQAGILAENVGQILWLTGLFTSTESSFKFVKKMVLNGIETIARLAMRLESVFMVDIASSDMYLLFATPGAEFDDTKMAKEFESSKASTRIRKGKDKVAGTTEVGVEKYVCGKKGEGLRVQVLSKAKVVLEGDLVV